MFPFRFRIWCPSPAQVLGNLAKIAFISAKFQGNFFQQELLASLISAGKALLGQRVGSDRGRSERIGLVGSQVSSCIYLLMYRGCGMKRLKTCDLDCEGRAIS